MNILLITSDQQHHSTLGATNPKIQTPALDRLAREGTLFGRAYCPNPTCTPTRASIITGQYPSRHGAWSLGTMLSPQIQTLGDCLRPLGYRSTLVGKAHFQPLDSSDEQPSIESYPTLHDLDFWRDFNAKHTPWYGFDHVELTRNHGDESHVGQHYALWMEEKGLHNWRDYFCEVGQPNGYGAWNLPEEFHYSTWTGERTMAALESAKRDETPFFIWASFHDPHPPYIVPEPYASMYDESEMEPGTLEPGELEKMPPATRLTQSAQDKTAFSMWQETSWANHGLHPHAEHGEKALTKWRCITE